MGNGNGDTAVARKEATTSVGAGRRKVHSDLDAAIAGAVAIVVFELGGHGGTHGALLDTGAELSYIEPTLLDEQDNPAGTQTDFFPGYGELTTKVYEKEILFGGIPFKLKFGVLPVDLFGGSLTTIGNEVINDHECLIELGLNRVTQAATSQQLEQKGLRRSLGADETRGPTPAGNAKGRAVLGRRVKPKTETESRNELNRRFTNVPITNGKIENTTTKRGRPKPDPEADRRTILLSGVPVKLVRQFDLEAYRLTGKRGGRHLGSGRSGLIIKAMELFIAAKSGGGSGQAHEAGDEVNLQSERRGGLDVVIDEKVWRERSAVLGTEADAIDRVPSRSASKRTPKSNSPGTGRHSRPLRWRGGISFKHMHSLTGLSSNYIRRILAGRFIPRLDKMKLLAKALGMSVHELVHWLGIADPAPLTPRSGEFPRLKVRDINQREVAKATGISTAYISRILTRKEEQRRQPRVEDLAILAKYFNVPIDHLIKEWTL